MRAPELLKGRRYILKRPRGIAATYEGKHEGVITLADGAILYSDYNYLRFRGTDSNGVSQIYMLENAGDVDEAEDTKIERERLEAETNARRVAAFNEAREFVESLGFNVVTKMFEARSKDAITIPTYGGETTKAEAADDVELDGITVGKLKVIIDRAMEKVPA